MSTGACGINCEACRLNQRGLCSSCGSGVSEQARLKLEAQQRLLGSPCPLLACARLNHIGYCLRDCDQFPCENFYADTITCYPFSSSYLNMQKRRRALVDDRKGDEIFGIPDQHWLEIIARGCEDVARHSGAVFEEADTLVLEMLTRTLRIDISRRQVEIGHEGRWLPAPPLPAFVAVVYLAKSKSIPLSGQWASEKDLSCREFFRGPHQLRTEALLDRFGHSAADFAAAAERYGGIEIGETGDAAVRLWVLPSIPLKLVLWCGDEELGPALTVLFDKSIDLQLPGDAIWALVQMVCEVLAHQSL